MAPLTNLKRKNGRKDHDLNEESESNKENVTNDFVPLASTRDPTRKPLLDRLPFAPISHHGDGFMHNANRNTKKKCEVTPAYAFRNATTGLLEIKTGAPDSFFVDTDMYSKKSENKIGKSLMTKPALYPIALNGGGVGLYNDPREFAVGGITNFSKNKHESAGVPSRGLTVFPWSMENSVASDEMITNRDSSLQGLYHTSWVDNSDVEAALDETLRSERQPVHSNNIFRSWKTWEKIHNFMVQISKRTQILGGETYLAEQLPTLPSNTRLSAVYNDDDFDFVLVLKPSEAYAYWAELLDFLKETHVLDGCETAGEDRDSDEYVRSDDNTETIQSLDNYVTPDTGVTKRRRKKLDDDDEESNQQSAGERDCKMVAKMLPKTEPPRKNSLFWKNSPPLSTGAKLATVDSSRCRVLKHRKSLFDRAIDAITPPRASLRNSLSPLRSSYNLVRSICNSGDSRRNSSKSSFFKTHETTQTSDCRSKPLACNNSYKKMNDGILRSQKSSSYEKLSDGRIKATKGRKLQKKKRNILEIGDIPTQVVPRGIAARTSGMEVFLSALKRGIVVRRHRPKDDNGVLIKISSSDGGDTLQYTPIKQYEALISFNEQIVRYNRGAKSYSIPHFVAKGNNMGEECKQDERESYDSFLPDHIAAEKYRDAKSRMSGGFKKITDLAVKVAQRGTFKAADIVAVHRANIPDPFSSNGECGSYTLRESKAQYNNLSTFSIVLLTGGIGLSNKQSSLKIASESWMDGNGSNKSFQYLDIEAATQGEFWMIFRGFLLLQRDAASGRFAAERASGFSSKYNQREVEYRSQHQQKEGKRETKPSHMLFQEPEDTSLIQKIFSRKEDKRCNKNNSMMTSAPPPDYFLGFKSAGTQIWSRLRAAGLETQRIYALDKKKVILKIRCPNDRLMDVAEAIRLKLKTSDGFYAPFQRSSLNQFALSDDDDKKNGADYSLFRSSERQQMIDFIIRSRIRDSGAELGEDKKLGKKIESRVPLHMHARLESLFISWVLFYKEINWVVGYEDNVMNTNAREQKNGQPGDSRDRQNIPHLFKRLILGSFNQPLDSIEEYFGEKVTFYFAWLQHCSLHLISLSLIGLVVFICQITSGRYDHPLRPYFSVIVMVWSFRVLVHWRKRQNFLAHRWGTLNYKEEETPRPQFHGDWVESNVAGEREHVIHYPPWKRWLKYCISIPLTAIFTITLLLVMLVVYANRDIFLARYFSDNDDIFVLDQSLSVLGKQEAIGSVSLTKEHLRDPKFWYIIGGIPAMIGLTLPLFNFILMQISRMLNEFENHRTETQYRTALIAKVIAFRFVCYFAAPYYYAYTTTGTDKEVVESGILRVASCLIVYFTLANWWSIFLNIYTPLLLLRWRLYRDRLQLRMELRKLERMELGFLRETTHHAKVEIERKLLNKRLLLEQAQSKIWEEVILPEYDPFSDYVQATMNFTYVVCFSAMLPIAPLLVLINQLLSMRLNAYKICRARRRPLAQKTGGIGVWIHVLHIVTVIAILTNCSLVTLTSSQFHPILESYGNMGLFVTIVAWEHIMLLIKYLMQALYSPYSKSVLDDMKKEGQKKQKVRNSNLRSFRSRYSGPQISVSSHQSPRNDEHGTHIKNVYSTTSTESDAITNHHVFATENINTKIQHVQENVIEESKSSGTKVNRQIMRSCERRDDLELKTPKQKEKDTSYNESIGNLGLDESPLNFYHNTNCESPKINQFTNKNYDKNFENNAAKKRIEARLYSIKKRKGEHLPGQINR